MTSPSIDATSWEALGPEVSALLATDLAAAAIPAWLERWSALECAVWEARAWPKRDRARNFATSRPSSPTLGLHRGAGNHHRR